MVRVASSSLLAAALVAGVLGHTPLKRNDDRLVVLLPEGLSEGEACKNWYNECSSSLPGAVTGYASCRDGSVYTGKDQTLLVSCTAETADGKLHDQTEVVIIQNSWIRDPPAGLTRSKRDLKSAAMRKRNDPRRAVLIGTSNTMGNFCNDWALECGSIKGATSGDANCEPNPAGQPYTTSALVACSIQVNGNSDWLDMTKYLIEVENLQTV